MRVPVEGFSSILSFRVKLGSALRFITSKKCVYGAAFDRERNSDHAGEASGCELPTQPTTPLNGFVKSSGLEARSSSAGPHARGWLKTENGRVARRFEWHGAVPLRHLGGFQNVVGEQLGSAFAVALD
jgi:hypothetical protein